MIHKVILIYSFFTKLILCGLWTMTSCDDTGFYNGDGYVGSNHCTTKNITNTPTIVITYTGVKRKTKIYKTKNY